MCCLQKIDEARKAVEEGVKEGESTTLLNKKEGVKERQCSYCKIAGHSKRTCSKKVNYIFLISCQCSIFSCHMDVDFLHLSTQKSEEAFRGENLMDHGEVENVAVLSQSTDDAPH